MNFHSFSSLKKIQLMYTKPKTSMKNTCKLKTLLVCITVITKENLKNKNLFPLKSAHLRLILFIDRETFPILEQNEQS